MKVFLFMRGYRKILPYMALEVVVQRCHHTRCDHHICHTHLTAYLEIEPTQVRKRNEGREKLSTLPWVL